MKVKPMPKEERCPYCEQRHRSLDQHRRFFKLVRELFRNWPERHAVTGEAMDFIPESEEQLRKYLTVKAGYRTVTVISVPRARNSMRSRAIAMETAGFAAAAVMRAAGDFPFVEVVGTSIEIMVADSIAFKSMGHRAFTELNGRIDAEILALTGLPAEAFLPAELKSKVRVPNRDEDGHHGQVQRET